MMYFSFHHTRFSLLGLAVLSIHFEIACAVVPREALEADLIFLTQSPILARIYFTATNVRQ